VPWKEEDFAEAICSLLAHPSEREQMGLRGRRYVLDNRSYKVIAEGVASKLKNILSADV
jgi:glycosyltransferase involved in cell wall biosynthesis